jgi:hypothetical protein
VQNGDVAAAADDDDDDDDGEPTMAMKQARFARKMP